MTNVAPVVKKATKKQLRFLLEKEGVSDLVVTKKGDLQMKVTQTSEEVISKNRQNMEIIRASGEW